MRSANDLARYQFFGFEPFTVNYAHASAFVHDGIHMPSIHFLNLMHEPQAGEKPPDFLRGKAATDGNEFADCAEDVSCSTMLNASSQVAEAVLNSSLLRPEKQVSQDHASTAFRESNPSPFGTTMILTNRPMFYLVA